MLRPVVGGCLVQRERLEVRVGAERATGGESREVTAKISFLPPPPKHKGFLQVSDEVEQLKKIFRTLFIKIGGRGRCYPSISLQTPTLVASRRVEGSVCLSVPTVFAGGPAHQPLCTSRPNAGPFRGAAFLRRPPLKVVYGLGLLRINLLQSFMYRSCMHLGFSFSGTKGQECNCRVTRELRVGFYKKQSNRFAEGLRPFTSPPAMPA